MFISFLSVVLSDTVANVIIFIATLLSLPFFAYGFQLIVFAYMWLFRFPQLRQWFNEKAGMDITPRSRLDKHLCKKAAIFYVGLAFFLIPGIIYGKKEYNKSVLKRGKRATIYRSIYLLDMMMTACLLFVLFCWLIVFMLAGGLAAKIYDFSMAPADRKSGASSRGQHHTNCYSCRHYENCEQVRNFDPFSHSCSNFSR